MLLDKFLDLLGKPLFNQCKAVSVYMTKIGTLLLAAFISVEFLVAYASANQNVFASRDDDTVSTGTVDHNSPQTHATTPAGLKIDNDGYEGRARGGDRLIDVGSTSTMSFFPRDLALSEVLVKEMDKNFGKCVQEAANAAGLRGTVTDINVAHMGGHNDRRINNGSRRRNRSWSLHSSGRALDIGRIDFTVGGKTLRVPMTIGSSRGRNGSEESRFYKGFVACWKKNVVNRCGSKTVLDCNHNRLHHDHVHISVPFCPRKPGIAST